MIYIYFIYLTLAVVIENTLRPSWLLKAFKAVDEDNNGALTLSEVKNVNKYLNFMGDDGELEGRFNVSLDKIVF